MPEVFGKSHTTESYQALQDKYETIDTNDPLSVEAFNKSMFEFNQALMFDQGVMTAMHTMISQLLQALNKV